MRGRVALVAGVIVASLLMLEIPIVVYLLLGGPFDEGIRALVAWNVFFAFVAGGFALLVKVME